MPVKDAKGDVVGMVTDRDICMASYIQGKPVGEIPVGAVWALRLCAIGPDDSVEQPRKS